MNILPKKRWHVRTKDNIARVRRDEAKAKEDEEKRTRRKQLAEKEARISELRCRIGYEEIQQSKINSIKEIGSGHVNLFAEYEEGLGQPLFNSKKHRKEQCEKNQHSEMLPTFLGQGTNEALKIKSWYEIPPQRYLKHSTNLGKELSESDSYKARKNNSGDVIKSQTSEKSDLLGLQNKSKKGKNTGTSVNRSIEKMREDRLKRETLEKSRQELTLLKVRGLIPEGSKSRPQKSTSAAPKYSSQFNPHIARQNK